MQQTKAVLFVILILALGLASITTGLFAQAQQEQEDYFNDDEPCFLCNLGLAGSVIGTTGLAFATVIELIGYASERSTT